MYKVRELAEIINGYALSQIQYEDTDIKVVVTKGAVQDVQTAPVVQEPVQATVEPPVCTPVPCEEKEYVRAPLAGVFYARPTPESKPFVKQGDTAQAGQTLCIVETMKIMNEVDAEQACTIVKVLKKDGELVEFDEPIFEVTYA